LEQDAALQLENVDVTIVRRCHCYREIIGHLAEFFRAQLAFALIHCVQRLKIRCTPSRRKDKRPQTTRSSPNVHERDSWRRALPGGVNLRAAVRAFGDWLKCECVGILDAKF
jgi:hypothetical protein